MTTAAPRRGWTSMNPPPPVFPASGNVTASAKAVATAASTALPPSRSTSRPTSDAGADTDTTVPRFETELNRSDEIADPDEAPPGDAGAQPVTHPKTRNNADFETNRRVVARRTRYCNLPMLIIDRSANLWVPSTR